KMSLFLLGTFYATMVAAGLAVEFLFQALGLVPTGPRHARVVEANVTFNYTTILNIVFLSISALLLARFLRTGGPAMLRMMKAPAGERMPGDGPTTYTCPMHPEVQQKEPGRCPKCGMDLVPASGEQVPD